MTMEHPQITLRRTLFGGFRTKQVLEYIDLLHAQYRTVIDKRDNQIATLCNQLETALNKTQEVTDALRGLALDFQTYQANAQTHIRTQEETMQAYARRAEESDLRLAQVEAELAIAMNKLVVTELELQAAQSALTTQAAAAPATQVKFEFAAPEATAPRNMEAHCMGAQIEQMYADAQSGMASVVEEARQKAAALLQNAHQQAAQTNEESRQTAAAVDSLRDQLGSVMQEFSSTLDILHDVDLEYDRGVAV